MKKVFLWALLMAGSLFIRAQTVTVTDRTTLLPLPGAVISDPNSGRVAATDNKGKADLSPFRNADSIRFSYTGYHEQVWSYGALEAAAFRVSLSEKSFEINEVVISASRFEEKKEDVPQQIQVIGTRELRFMNVQTSADVIQQSGNVLVQKSQQGGGSPVIRGFEANKVLLVVDGVRLNNAIYRGGHLQNVITLDNSILEKTEIVFGPGSVVYGSDALGGVMHFHTRNPVLADSGGKTLVHANAFARYSSANNENTFHADASVGGQRFGSLTSFSVSSFDDLRQGGSRDPFYGDWGKRFFYADWINGRDTMMVNDNANIQKSSGYNQFDFLQKFFWKPGAHTSHTLNLQYSTTSDINRYDRLTETDDLGVFKHAQWYYGPQERFFAAYSFQYDKKLTIADHIRLTAGYQDLEESRHNRGFGSDNLQHRTENVQVMTLNADISKDIRNNELRYGAEFTYNDVASSAYAEDIVTGGVSGLDTRYPSGGSSMFTAAAYLTHTWEASGKFVLSDGLRFSYVGLDALFDDTTFYKFPFTEVTQRNSAVNGNLGFAWMPGRGWRFTAVGATGFRAPNVDDVSKVFDSSPGEVVVPNPDLGPEYTWNAEAGIAKSVGDHIRVETVGYYTWYRDAIVIRPGTFNGADSIMYDGVMSKVMTSTNAGSAYIRGAGVSLHADVTQSFSMFGTVNYTYGRVETDSTDLPLDHIPPVFGKAGLSLTVRQFRCELYVMFNGWKHIEDYNPDGEDNQQYATEYGMPAWQTLNIKTAWQVNRYAQLQVALENILDQNYRVFASGISAPGRNLVVTVRGRF
jgi:hemoglobin/transferrin/lactoferrin receptor protein